MPDATTTRWIRNAADEYAVSRGCRFDERRAEHVVRFFREHLRHTKDPWVGRPFDPLEWQVNHLLMPLFGWVLPERDPTGKERRRFNEAYIEIPKKNGKSTISAGIGLYLTVADEKQGGLVFSVATKLDQARIVHDEAVAMAEASPTLCKALNINRSSWTITYPTKNCRYAAAAADGKGTHGKILHGIIADEMHAWNNQEFYDSLKFGTRGSFNGLLFMITTAGHDITTIGFNRHEYVSALLEGHILDERYFGLIYSADTTDDWQQPETWRKANPSLGVTILEDDMRVDCQRAALRPVDISAFRRLRLNQWLMAGDPWFTREQWAACGGDFDLHDMAGRECIVGMDLSVTDDMTALALWFPEDQDEDGDYPGRLLCYFYLPQDTINDPTKPNEYRSWCDHEYVIACPGPTMNYSYLEQTLAFINAKCPIMEIAFDRYQAGNLIETISEKMGIRCVEYPQRLTHMAESSAEFERLVLRQKLTHNRHPVLSWQAGHVQIETRNGLIRPIKPKDKGDVRKIDGIVAAVMALGRAMDPENRARLGGGQLLVEFV